ncbi:MAG: putative metal-dependent hydrolase [Bacteroidota bacterium]
MQDLETLKYPIGEYAFPENVDNEQIKTWINSLESFPQQLAEVVTGLSPGQLDCTYRPGGWTVRQIVHHLADSHVNAYTRLKLALTEDVPVIRPYHEERWAELPDAKSSDIELSISIIIAIHKRLVSTFRTLEPKDFKRKYIHPAIVNELTISYLLGNYAWHGQHHLAHIKLTIS